MNRSLAWLAESFLRSLLAKLSLIGLLARRANLSSYCRLGGHVAQLDRASDSGSEGRGFESLHARIN